MSRSRLAKCPRRVARQRSFYFHPQIDNLEQRTMLAADLGFTPLPTSATTLNPGSTGGNAPFNVGAGFTQTVVQRAGNPAGSDDDLGTLLGQNTLNENGPQAGRYLFSTALETTIDPDTGGIVGTLNRTDLVTGDTINLLSIAIAEGQDPDDPDASVEEMLTLQNLRAIRWTPWGTLLVGEAIDANGTDQGGNPFSADPDLVAAEAENGLVYEVVNPTSNRPVVFARPALGSGRIEGIDIDSLGNIYLDDNNGLSSSVFRFVPADSGSASLEAGELQVLLVGEGAVQFGAEARWVPLDPMVASMNVRAAIDDLVLPDDATSYGITRDLAVGIADFGEDESPDETLYVTLQGDNLVIAIDLDGETGDDRESPFVYNFVDASTDPDFNDPVDIEVDAAGRVYIGEAIDPPPGPSQPAAGNDVWVANDRGDDVDSPVGVIDTTDPSTDQFGRLASLRVSNASVAGLYVSPFNSRQIYVNVSSSTENKNAIVRLDGGAGSPMTSGVFTGDDGNGGTTLTIVGTPDGDRIVVSGVNILTIRIGTQRFRAEAANQVFIYGLGGDDSIVASTGSFFDYVIFGGDGSDYIAAGSGNDTVYGEGGNDRLLGGIGNNFLSGGDGNDSLSSGGGGDVMDGGAGNDRITTNAGNDTLFGGDGNDILNGGFGDDFIDGGAGIDYLDGYYGNDVVFGGAGNDYVKGGSGQDVVIGGDGLDQLFGGDQADLMIGDQTAVDEDEAGLRGLAVLWQTAFADPDRDQQVQDYLDDADGDDDPDEDDGIINDNDVDILDGNNQADLFYRFGTQDKILRLTFADEVVQL
jgi:Ca2+-binding RTX toxin-like protein